MSENFDDYLTFLSSARTYLHLEYSVIPLRGTNDPSNPKVPSIRWKPHQSLRASESDLQRWAADGIFGGIGIVTGHISQLAVLDFDNLQLFEQFEAAYPTLCETRQVETRRGRHLYFHIPSHIKAQTTKCNGVDWLYNGAYVVAPPSVINGHRYKLCRGGLPRTLSQSEIRQIEVFLRSVGMTEDVSSKSEIAPISIKIEANQPERRPSLNDESLIRVYQSLSEQKKSRNEGLFYAALHARDCGWSAQQTIDALAQSHAQVNPLKSHKSESFAQRLAEAHRTIHSAFSRPAANQAQNSYHGLPNTLRELLLAKKQTALLRLLEALTNVGYVGGEIITRCDMANALQVQPDYRVIREATVAQTPAGLPVFQRRDPSSRPPSHANAASHCTNVPRTKCFVREKKRSEKRGRPPIHYRMPSVYELCDWFDVPFSGSDELPDNALKSAYDYRQALHTEFINRRPGQYSREFLAKRLAVSKRTLDKYNHSSHIQKQTMYDSQPIYWSNLNQLPFDLMMGGHFLKDKHGKSYPMVRAIVIDFLKQGKPIWYVRQTVNHYRCAQEVPHKMEHYAPPSNTFDVKAYFDKLYQSRPHLKITVKPTQNHLNQSLPPEEATSQQMIAAKLPEKRKKRYRRRLDSFYAEKRAQQIQQEINQMLVDKSQKLSLRKARQLVDEQGAQSVQAAIQRISKRQNVRNPVGLLITMMRC